MPSFTLKLATLLRSRREKFLRFTTSSEICSMPCSPSFESDSRSPSTWCSRKLREARVHGPEGLLQVGRDRPIPPAAAPCRRSDWFTASFSSGRRSRTVATLFFTYASGVLISWATPATIWPSEDIFSLCTSCASDSFSLTSAAESSFVRSTTRFSRLSLASRSAAWAANTRAAS